MLTCLADGRVCGVQMIGPLSLEASVLMSGYDKSILGWASRAAGEPQIQLHWDTSKGEQRAMPAWSKLSLQHRYMLSALAGKPLEDLPLPRLLDNVQQQAQDKSAAAQLKEHAVQNSGKQGRSLDSFFAEELRTASKVLLWQAECLQTIMRDQKFAAGR